MGAKYMAAMCLAGNALTGPVPDFSAWTHVTDLVLARNKLTGTVPGQILQLPAAVRVDLVSTVSNESCKVKLQFEQLSTCALQSHNLLGGAMADVIPSGPALQLVYLNNNKLSTRFPFLYGSTEISVYDLSSNELSGAMVSSFSGSNSEASSLYYTRFLSLDASNGIDVDVIFSSNQLTGTIPDWLAAFPSSVCIRKQRV